MYQCKIFFGFIPNVSTKDIKESVKICSKSLIRLSKILKFIYLFLILGGKYEL